MNQVDIDSNRLLNKYKYMPLLLPTRVLLLRLFHLCRALSLLLLLLGSEKCQSLPEGSHVDMCDNDQTQPYQCNGRRHPWRVEEVPSKWPIVPYQGSQSGSQRECDNDCQADDGPYTSGDGAGDTLEDD